MALLSNPLDTGSWSTEALPATEHYYACGCAQCAAAVGSLRKHVVIDDAAAATPATVSAAALPYYTNALLYPTDWRWNADQPHGSAVTVSFSFMTSNPGSYGGFRAFSASEKVAARDALADWAKVCNISFTEVASGGQIALGSADVGGASGITLWSGTSGRDSGMKTTHADVYMSSTQGLGYADGGFGMRALLHEIGHSLGLKHTFDSSGSTLSGVENTAQYSVMSYDNPPNTPNAQPSTPQLYDIAAVQYLYGTNKATNSGDTTYQWSASKAQVMTIWDGGGFDTMDGSNQTLGCTLDLREGKFSSLGLYNGALAKNTVAVAFGTVIEKAVGGSGSDTIIGNDHANVLVGGAGSDKLSGGLGNDTYFVDSVGDSVVEYGGQGLDTIKSSLSFTLVSYVENLTLTGTGAINGTGSSWHNQIIGNESDNTLKGLAGNDTLKGMGGNDVLVGGAGQDRLSGGSGADTYRYLSTADGGDTITDFTSASDKLWFDDAAFALALGGAQSGVNFSKIAAAYDGSNASATDYAAGKGALIVDSTGTLYYDANGKAAGYHVIATIQSGATIAASDIIIA